MGSSMEENGLTKDHFLPKSHGFDLCGNKVFACASCNNKKGNSYPSVKEIIKFIKIHDIMKAKERKKLVVRTHNDKPIFKLKMTADLINYHSS